VMAKAESATADVKAIAHAAVPPPIREARQEIGDAIGREISREMQRHQDARAAPAAPSNTAPSAGVPLRNAALPHDHPERVASNTPAEQPSFFERLFGKPPSLALGYANADDGTSAIAASYGGATAVYDISARTVYMPDGPRLEAHSGLGPFLDDPRYADRKDRGVTPPDVYDLELREGLFHGVQ